MGRDGQRVVDRIRRAWEQAIAGLAGAAAGGRPASGAEAGADVGMPVGGRVRRDGRLGASAASCCAALIAGACPVPITRVRGFGIPTLGRAGDAGGVRQLLRATRPRRSPAPTRRTPRARRLLCCGRRRGAGRAGRRVGRAVRAGARRPAAAGRARLPVRGDRGRVRGRPGWRRPGWPSRRRPGPSWSIARRPPTLGRRLAATVPLVYGAGPLAAVAYRWKTQLNENAKMPPSATPSPSSTTTRSSAGRAQLAAPFAAVMLRDPSEPGRERSA